MVHRSKSSKSTGHSDLEVVPGKGIEVVHVGLEAASLEDLESRSWKSLRSATANVGPLGNAEECGDGKKTGRVCGLRLRTFWIVLVVGTIVIAASVGAAIVGSLLKKRDVSDMAGKTKETATVLADLSTSTVSTTLTAPSTLVTTDTPAATTVITATTSNTRPVRTAATATSTSPLSTTPTTFPASGQLELDCPHLDGTDYISKKSPVSAHDFKIWCNTDYRSPRDISVHNTTSIQECIDLCSLVDSQGPQLPCRGIAFNSNITEARANGGTCLLKADVTAPFVRSDLTQDSYAGAVLIR